MSNLPTVSLPGTTIETSVLGFGCSRLLGPTSSNDALRLLETAYDSGIRHFDVARAYASGDAEHVVGRFIARHREDVTVTTKFGMRPLPQVAGRRVLRATARRLMKVSPVIRRFLGRQGATLVKRNAFSLEEAKASLETSLRELRTEYVDIFLLHDCNPEDCSPELLDFLNDAVAAGKVRAFGVGSSVESVRSIAQSRPEFAHVLQFEHSALRPTLDLADPAGERAVITHGAIAGVGRLHRHLAANQELRMQWSVDLGRDCGDVRSLAALLLQYAVRTNRRGPVLFSTTRAENIVANAAAIGERVPASTLDAFAALASSTLEHARAGAVT